MALIWSDKALADLFRIFEFNLGFSAERATKVQDRLVGAGHVLARRPLIGRPFAGPTVRLYSVTDIQYVIRYQIDGEDLTILRIRHTREKGEQGERP
ncbi:MAG: type II toxin-antitoxin system RelE/ParE family toxin [Sphingomonas sp.]|nr:type II toxin-antitoxin system RelE/ParE family toxin [Sphingomonas sp.]